MGNREAFEELHNAMKGYYLVLIILSLIALYKVSRWPFIKYIDVVYYNIEGHRDGRAFQYRVDSTYVLDLESKLAEKHLQKKEKKELRKSKK